MSGFVMNEQVDIIRQAVSQDCPRERTTAAQATRHSPLTLE
jgi:hypothetical protein